MNYYSDFIRLYKKELKLNEGLIKTVNRDKAINIIKNNFGMWFKFEISNIIPKNKIIIHGKSNIGKDDFIRFVKLVNNLGWFISMLYTKNNSFKYKDGIENKIFKDDFYEYFISIYLEMKYDEEIDPIPEKLYHITDIKYSKKIEKIGLSPRSAGKLSAHPERIYFGFTKEDASDLAAMFKVLTGSRSFVLYEIDTDLVPAYLRLFSDPNYYGKGCYTMNNIPPSAITKKELIQI